MDRLRRATKLLCIAAILAIPALCMAGATSHECDCGQASECSHETGCLTDPCTSMVVRPRHADADADADASTRALIPAALEPQSPETGERVVHPARAPTPPRHKRLPFPQSDIPLRI